MKSILLSCVATLFVAGAIHADDTPPAGDKVLPGMSVVGNDEAPKSLVIVPWKSSVMGDTLDVSRLPDDGRQPVDRDVFQRELDYYRIRAGTSDTTSR